jgi:hypothetical protein
MFFKLFILKIRIFFRTIIINYFIIINLLENYLKNTKLFIIKKQEFINWFRRTSKTKIYTLCEGQPNPC